MSEGVASMMRRARIIMGNLLCGPGSSAMEVPSSIPPVNGPHQMRVALLGDSTLDNVAWLRHKEHSICRILTRMLQQADHVLPSPSSPVVFNLAADGFNSQDVLGGGNPGQNSRNARAQAGDPFPEGQEYTFSPLHILPMYQPTHVVISLGCNIGDRGPHMRKVRDVPARLTKLLKDYPKILDKATGVCRQVVLIAPYQPCAVPSAAYGGFYSAIAGALPGNHGLTALEKLDSLMESVYKPICKMAASRRIPVIDLRRTFNPQDESLYEYEVEPSRRGGTLIAALITFVLKHHNFEGQSITYWIPPERSSQIVASAWSTTGRSVPAGPGVSRHHHAPELVLENADVMRERNLYRSS